MRPALILVGALAVTAAACTLPPPPPPPPPPPTTTTTSTSTTTTTTVPAPPAPVLDYAPGDRVWVDLDTGAWYLAGTLLYQGEPGDVPVAADYDGDGRTEIVVVRGDEWVRPDGSVIADLPAPAVGYLAQPVPADYDGDGVAEPAWYRVADATWWIDGATPVTFGSGPTLLPPQFSGGPVGHLDFDLPVPADYDGDGRTDLATYSPRTGAWTIRSSADSSVTSHVLRAPTTRLQLPAPADYDGVGHAQLALLDADGWLVEGHAVEPLPASTLDGVVIPAPIDEDGDGRAERSYVEIDRDPSAWWWRSPGPGGDLDLVHDESVPAVTGPWLLYSVTRLGTLERCVADPTASGC